MLSLNIKKLSLEDKVNNIFYTIIQIPCDVTMQNIKQLIYTKTQYHTVKCLSFDMEWCIKKEFQDVTNAIIRISSILFALQKYSCTMKEGNSKIHVMKCTDEIRIIYNLLKEGLREYGCSHPPFMTGTCLKKEDILKATDIINSTWLQNTCSVNRVNITS